ncbi:MAG: SDR family NAD(P)-dependent oxidoreductase [Chloroflexi bacterium]|nr:SDR family NAD(P)-dependent oxidoreductase [Chloroflexota bacterium]
MNMMRRMFLGGFLGGTAYWFWRYFAPEHSTLVLGEKVVVITGASSGIGRALAMTFARRGARVVLVARRAEKLEVVQREIEPYADAVLVIPGDISDPATQLEIIQKTRDTFGRVDILVNNAGITGGGLFHDFAPDEIDEIVGVNLLAALQLTRQALPTMLAQREGYIINIGSGFGRAPTPGFAAYVASKFGLSGFSEALARELVGSGVRVLLAQPGWTRTEMLPPEVEAGVTSYWWYRVEDPEVIAEKIAEGLVQGKREMIFGGRMVQVGILAERHFPLLMRLLWRWELNSRWLSLIRKIG